MSHVYVGHSSHSQVKGVPSYPMMSWDIPTCPICNVQCTSPGRTQLKFLSNHVPLTLLMFHIPNVPSHPACLMSYFGHSAKSLVLSQPRILQHNPNCMSVFICYCNMFTSQCTLKYRFSCLIRSNPKNDLRKLLLR